MPQPRPSIFSCATLVLDLEIDLGQLLEASRQGGYSLSEGVRFNGWPPWRGKAWHIL